MDILDKRKTSSPIGNCTTIPQPFSLKPSHYADYIILVPLATENALKKQEYNISTDTVLV
jgi:hypothetical protein